MSVCKISGKMKLATTVFVVAFDMQKAKKSPAGGGARFTAFWQLLSSEPRVFHNVGRLAKQQLHHRLLTN